MKAKWQEQIDHIMDVTDFDDWSERMKLMGWRWGVLPGAVKQPTASQLCAKSIDYLQRVVNEKLRFISSGGVTAIKAKGQLFLCLGDTTAYEGEL